MLHGVHSHLDQSGPVRHHSYDRMCLSEQRTLSKSGLYRAQENCKDDPLVAEMPSLIELGSDFLVRSDN